ncbi:MAG TPA: hypothetical protein VNJ08_03165 [Bacteriovoracaceae bacterium]|nr:hypothetical protein [Bacteriovoracaceae bacterium]
MFSESYFIANTRAIISILSLDQERYLSIFGMTPAEGKKYLANPKDFPAKYAMNFCEYFELDMGVLFSNKFDAKTFARNFELGQPALPDQYQQETNSKVITLINIIQGLESSGHEWLSQTILRRLQIPKTLLLYPEQAIPFKMIVDFLQLVEDFRTDLKLMKSFGQIGIQNLNAKFKFVGPQTAFNDEFYDQFFSKEIRQFDQSYQYKITRFKNNLIILSCTLREEFKEIYHRSSLSNAALLEYKAGISSGLSTLFNLPLSEVSIISSNQLKGIDTLAIKLPYSSHSLVH